jgi:arabinofuranosyltransferase
MNAPTPPRRWTPHLVLGLTALTLLAAWLANAWVSEDAHITARTLENFVSGRGLRWNLDERVQVYTHPLWLLLLAPFYGVTRELYWTLTALSLALSLGAYLLVAWHFRRQPWVLGVGIFAPWLLSRCLRVYATSGFENPLTALLLAAFAARMLDLGRGREIPWGRLALLTALAGVNRLDTLALYAPALLLLAAPDPRRLPWARIALGLAPLIAWLAFSLLYYGFLFPNTAYAKLSSAIPRSTYFEAGALYLADLALTDLVSLLILGLGAASSLACLRHALAHREDRRAAGLAGLGGGALLYGLYVFWIGGDFLSGRYWSAPVLASIVLCAANLEPLWGWLRRTGTRRRVMLTGLALVSLVAARAVAAQVRDAVPGDVRARSAGHVALIRGLRWEPSPRARDFQQLGDRLRRAAGRDRVTVAVVPVIGLASLAAGPDVLVLDPYALADPLLARLPPADPTRLLIGHLKREIPAGYLEARETGGLDAMHPALADYYRKLRLVVSGPLLDRDRLRTIAGFQLGRYDGLLREYLERPSRDP